MNAGTPGGREADELLQAVPEEEEARDDPEEGIGLLLVGAHERRHRHLVGRGGLL
jgi:hypothetical protein